MHSAALLRDLVFNLNQAFQKETKSKAMTRFDFGDYGSLLAQLISLRQDVVDELSNVDFRSETRRVDLIDKVLQIERELINALMSRDGNTTGPLVPEVNLERLASIADQLEEKGASDSPTIDRSHMMMETESLLNDVKNWDLEEHPKKTLIMQLGAIQRIIHAADVYSDREVRFHVKAIITDFSAEFERMDREHRAMLERLLGWGRSGFFRGNAILGLTANASTVVALLTGPAN